MENNSPSEHQQEQQQELPKPEEAARGGLTGQVATAISRAHSRSSMAGADAMLSLLASGASGMTPLPLHHPLNPSQPNNCGSSAGSLSFPEQLLMSHAAAAAAARAPWNHPAGIHPGMAAAVAARLGQLPALLLNGGPAATAPGYQQENHYLSVAVALAAAQEKRDHDLAIAATLSRAQASQYGYECILSAAASARAALSPYAVAATGTIPSTAALKNSQIPDLHTQKEKDPLPTSTAKVKEENKHPKDSQNNNDSGIKRVLHEQSHEQSEKKKAKKTMKQSLPSLNTLLNGLKAKQGAIQKGQGGGHFPMPRKVSLEQSPQNIVVEVPSSSSSDALLTERTVQFSPPTVMQQQWARLVKKLPLKSDLSQKQTHELLEDIFSRRMWKTKNSSRLFCVKGGNHHDDVVDNDDERMLHCSNIPSSCSKQSNSSSIKDSDDEKSMQKSLPLRKRKACSSTLSSDTAEKRKLLRSND